MRYRKGIGIFLVNSNRKLWVGKRIDTNRNYWQMPQGGIDQSETDEEAMKREMYEEVGICSHYEIIGISQKLLSYDLPKEIKRYVWNGKYKGQLQRWFFCKFLGNDSMFNLQIDDKPEFCDWKWINPCECKNIVVPFKRSLYEEVLKEFENIDVQL